MFDTQTPNRHRLVEIVLNAAAADLAGRRNLQQLRDHANIFWGWDDEPRPDTINDSQRPLLEQLAHMIGQIVSSDFSNQSVEDAAKALYVAMNPEWPGAGIAWEDMGGSEPSLERAELEIAMETGVSALKEYCREVIGLARPAGRVRTPQHGRGGVAVTARDWIAKHRENMAADAEWTHEGGGIIAEWGSQCTCSPHYGAHELHCGNEHVMTAPDPRLADVIVDTRNSFALALEALEASTSVMAEHWNRVMAQAAKFGRTKPDCVCDICRAMLAIESILGGGGRG